MNDGHRSPEFGYGIIREKKNIIEYAGVEVTDTASGFQD